MQGNRIALFVSLRISRTRKKCSRRRQVFNKYTDNDHSHEKPGYNIFIYNINRNLLNKDEVSKRWNLPPIQIVTIEGKLSCFIDNTCTR